MTATPPKIHPVALLFAVALSGCASTPEPLSELEDAGTQASRARAGDAARYAPVELRFAEQKIERARLAMNERDRAEATRLLREAEVDAELALAKTRQGKARESVETKAGENARLRQEIGGEQP